MKPVTEAKSFDIAKWEVWDAYKRVKANRGAAGVDGVSLQQFDQELSKNLYRIWNRMASGSYFPSPVKRVDIPKGDGKTRPLGIRLRTGLHRWSFGGGWNRGWNRCSIGTPMDTGRVARHTMPCGWPGVGVGNVLGCSMWTSKASLTILITTC